MARPREGPWWHLKLAGTLGSRTRTLVASLLSPQAPLIDKWKVLFKKYRDDCSARLSKNNLSWDEDPEKKQIHRTLIEEHRSLLLGSRTDAEVFSRQLYL